MGNSDPFTTHTAPRPRMQSNERFTSGDLCYTPRYIWGPGDHLHKATSICLDPQKRIFSNESYGSKNDT